MALETEFPDKAVAVTASNSLRFKQKSTIYVGVGGNVAVIPWGNVKDTPVIFAVGTGGVVPVSVRAVLSTSTTATSLLRIY